jgi:hypothetical protein
MMEGRLQQAGIFDGVITERRGSSAIDKGRGINFH